MEMEDRIYPGGPLFTNHQGETLSLLEISRKNITLISFVYLSSERRISVGGLKGWLGFTTGVQDEKEGSVEDDDIALYYCHDRSIVSIRLYSKEEFEKFVDYDENTLWKRIIPDVTRAYQICFMATAIQQIDWI
jgi:hypothetical protein